MDTYYDKYGWLELAFCEPIDRLNESYHFDRRDNQFFSVFITDYFLTDPLSTETYTNNLYTTGELSILNERITRLEANDPSIINLPRLTMEERKD